MNLSYNHTEYQYDPLKTREIQTVFCVLYTAIFVLGILGNFLTCYVVLRNKTMQTVTNFFITNLALSDILLCTLSVPFTPLYTFLGEWVFGPALCHTVSYSQGVSVYISTFTLTSIAIDRFFVIIHPFRPRMKITTCFVIILSIWLFSVLVTLPYGIYVNLSAHNVTNIYLNQTRVKYFCEEQWPSETFRCVFGAITVVLQFVLPFLIIAFCYIKVSLKLNDRARCKPGAKNSKKEEVERERKRRTNRMLIAMVAIFGLSWLPFSFVNFLNDLHSESDDWSYYNLCFFVVHALAMSSTCYNPFLYAWLNENFRKEFKQVLPGFNSSARRSSNDRGVGGWRSERTCNGNETCQESLLQSTTLVRRCSSIRIQLAEATKDLKDRGELVEVEKVLVPKVSFNPSKEQVHFHVRSSDDDLVHLKTATDECRSSPPRSTDTTTVAETGEDDISTCGSADKVLIGTVDGEPV